MNKIVLLNLKQNHLQIARSFIGLFIIVVFEKDGEKNYNTSQKIEKIKYSSIQSGDGLLEKLTKYGKKEIRKPFIFPATDEEVLFLIKNKNELEKYFVLSIPEEEKFKNLSDKFLIQEELRRCGFRYPTTSLLKNNGIEEEKIDFPCILKPAFSGHWKTDQSNAIVGEQKVVVVHSLTELKLNYEKYCKISPRMIAQSIIEPAEGDIYSFCSYSDRFGKVLHGFVTQKLIQYPEGFGTALLCQTVEHPEVYELGKQVIESLGVDGVCETEIIRDARTGELFIIEINTRHWMQHRLSARLGVNYSLLDFYYRTGDASKVTEVLGNGRGRANNIIWFDDVGYLIYAVKNFFNPKKCKMKEIFKNHWEFSLFSLSDWRPFVGCLRQKISR